MRLYEYSIYMYDAKAAEITGEADPSSDIKRRFVIDLDEVCAAWQGKDSGIVILLKNGESFWLKGVAIDDFYGQWNGCATTPQPVQSVGIGTGAKSAGSTDPCPLCGCTVIVQEGLLQKCDKCGFTVAPSSLRRDGKE